MRERYLIAHESDGKLWFLGKHSVTDSIGWVREDNGIDRDDFGILVYNNYNAAKRLLVAVQEEEEPKAFIHILHF